MAKAHIALSTINQQTGKKQVAMKPNFQPFILNQYQKYHTRHKKRMVMVFNQQILDFIVFNATFSYIMATSFSSGRSRSPRREPHGQATGKLYHLRVECTLFCNLQSQAQTHAVLVLGL